MKKVMIPKMWTTGSYCLNLLSVAIKKLIAAVGNAWLWLPSV